MSLRSSTRACGYEQRYLLLRQEHSALEERCDDELYRLLQEVDRHESGEKRAKEGQDKQREGADRRDADKKALEEDVKELQKHQSWECATLSTHDDLPARPGSYAIVRLYDYDKRSKHGKASLWWTFAEILAVVEGDGISPDCAARGPIVQRWTSSTCPITPARSLWRCQMSRRIDPSMTAASSPRMT